MSLLKYRSTVKENGRGKLFWERADSDGAPFRGVQAPLLREDEFENQTAQVWDAHVDKFDLSDPAQKAKLEEILDAAYNDWYRVGFMERQFIASKEDWVVYIEYAIPYREQVK